MPNIDLGKVVGAQGPEGPVAHGTMMEATYDPNGKSQDVFAYADAAKQEAKDYAAPKTHASQHANGGSDPITPADIGAADSGHSHAWSAITGKPSTFTPSSHNHAASDVNSGTFDADRIPTLEASKVTSGTFAATGVIAKTGTDYTTYRIRNIAANTTAMTAGSTALSNGNIYLQYE